MMNVLDVAIYLKQKYQKQYGEIISEMKLHKMLYFAQRESLIEDGIPIFSEEFEGWKYGPILPTVRRYYPDIIRSTVGKVDHRSKDILDYIVKKYGCKDAWSLSRLTHGEYSWQKSRIGVAPYDNSDRTINIEDIRVDAERIKDRRRMLNMLKG